MLLISLLRLRVSCLCQSTSSASELSTRYRSAVACADSSDDGVRVQLRAQNQLEFFCKTRFASTFMPVRGTRLSILQFDTSPQRPMGRLLGAEKINFLMSRYGRRHHGGRVGGILSIRGPEVSPRSPMVGKIHVQSPTPHARELPSVDTYGNSPSQTSHLPMICQRFESRALSRAPRTGACGVGDYPTPDLSRRESRSRSTSEKSK